MKTLLLFTLMAFVGLILSIVYFSYLFFLARKSRQSHNSSESIITFSANEI